MCETTPFTHISHPKWPQILVFPTFLRHMICEMHGFLSLSLFSLKMCTILLSRSHFARKCTLWSAGARERGEPHETPRKAQNDPFLKGILKETAGLRFSGFSGVGGPAENTHRRNLEGNLLHVCLTCRSPLLSHILSPSTYTNALHIVPPPLRRR